MNTEALGYIVFYGTLLIVPLYQIYTAYFRKAPIIELSGCIEKRRFYKIFLN